MTYAYQPIDLSNLPAPKSITPVSFDQEKKDLITLFRQKYPNYDTLLESDPAYKIIEAFAYRLAVEKQRRNEALKGVMLAFAQGSDLDQLGANLNIDRLVVTQAQDDLMPPVPAVMENDQDFRQRIQLSFEKYSTAGSIGSYVFHARSASSKVADVQVTSPSPGTVVLYVMGRDNNGTADADLLDIVYQAVNADDVRPLTDYVKVKTAEIIPYSITATLELYPGPDSNVVKKTAYSALLAYCESVHKIGYLVAKSGIYAALQQPGVQNVLLQNWENDLPIKEGQVSYCTDIQLKIAGESDV